METVPTPPASQERSEPTGFVRIAPDARLGKNVLLGQFVSLKGCRIGDDTTIGSFVEIQKNAMVGSRCHICGQTTICDGVVIEDEVFIGNGVTFVNDMDPQAMVGGKLRRDVPARPISTRVCRGASVGSGAVVLAGITIGAGALIGAGAIVTHDVVPGTVVAGCPARLMRMREGI
jgi:acetyltransferase-like isoleucine patch superfamily enzyme